MCVVVECEGHDDWCLDLPEAATVRELCAAVKDALAVRVGKAVAAAASITPVERADALEEHAEALAAEQEWWAEGDVRLCCSVPTEAVAREWLARKRRLPVSVAKAREWLREEDWETLRWTVDAGLLPAASLAQLLVERLDRPEVLRRLVEDCGVNPGADPWFGAWALEHMLGASRSDGLSAVEMTGMCALFTLGAVPQPSRVAAKGGGADGLRDPLFYLSAIAAAAGEGTALALLRVLLEQGADPHLPDANTKATPLHDVAAAHLPALTSALLAAGCDVRRATHSGETVLHLAAAGAAGTNVQHLVTAATGGTRGAQIEVVTALVDAAGGADGMGRAAFVNKEDSRGRTALHDAAGTAAAGVAAVLLANGADANARAGEKIGLVTPLHVAARRGGAEGAAIAGVLLRHGAAADAKDGFEKRPLHLAAENADVAVVRTLLAASAEVDARDRYQKTPLMLASIYCSPALSGSTHCDAATRQSAGEEIIRALAAAGADPTLADRNQRTPLHLAAGAGLRGHVQVLLDICGAVAPLTAEDAMGNTPHRCAMVNGHPGVAALLPKERPARGNCGAPSKFTRMRQEARLRGGAATDGVAFCLVEKKPDPDRHG